MSAGRNRQGELLLVGSVMKPAQVCKEGFNLWRERRTDDKDTAEMNDFTA